MVTGKVEASAAHPPEAIDLDAVEAMPDEHLLDRYLGTQGAESEAAFRAMVVRHGPMVLGVCRHILNQHQDAEDAFQAAFLVLARKAGSIKDRRVLGRWLYEVAYRIAVRAKMNANRRRTHERQGAAMAATAPEFNAGWSELRPVLHEEVNRLPEKYRTPVVLCYLEGKTNEEVAQLLKWPVGTVKGRLSRARELLRSRLTRRGLALSAAFLVTALSQNAVFAEVVPSRLIDDTVDNAMKLGKGKAASVTSGAIPPAIAALMSEAQGHAVALRLALALALLALAGTAALGASGWFPALASVRMAPGGYWSMSPLSSGGVPVSCHAPAAPSTSAH